MIYQISFIGVITKNDYDLLQIKIDFVNGQEVAIDNGSNVEVGDSTRIIICCGYHQFTKIQDTRYKIQETLFKVGYYITINIS